LGAAIRIRKPSKEELVPKLWSFSVALITTMSLCAIAGSAGAQTPTTPVSAFLYLVQFTTGPAWVKDKPPHEQLHFAAHSANLKRLRSEEKLVLGARNSDKGIVILRASSEAEARAAVDSDESVRAGVFAAEIFEFRPFYDGCVAKPAPVASPSAK
jgi:uncharacterized protein YciI